MLPELYIVARGNCLKLDLGKNAARDAPNASPPWLHLQIMFRTSITKQEKYAELTAKILDAVSPLTHVRFVHLEIPRDFFTMKALKKPLSSLDGVKILHLQSESGGDFFKALLQPKRKNSKKVAIFPLLWTLSLKDVDFGPERAAGH
ncbi:hypothetical protein D9758_007497 [Tetrapyrgos nigripes]|uniref:Uncharacterized protein n=1 Tax=Tetrapyrgos nigripes TaxID=182062 RepID=A0A8H5LHT1_9AGAR|nr:hypothetical protein D9758_007497 [Tetrapyrgos nigripes]